MDINCVQNIDVKHCPYCGHRVMALNKVLWIENKGRVYQCLTCGKDFTNAKVEVSEPQ